MTPDEKLTARLRLDLMMTEGQKRRFDAWILSHEGPLPSKAAAARSLIVAGLDASDAKPFTRKVPIMPTSTTLPRTGFTGTPMGMTKAQHLALRNIMSALNGWWVHGDTVGADAQSHMLALDLGLFVEIHPPLNSRARARCKDAARVHRMRGYIDRNHDIVDATARLIAAPQDAKGTLHSGTWATVRYARSLGRPVTLIFPDGSVQEERCS